MKLAFMFVALLAADLPTAGGAPLDLRLVPASATWLAHVDVDALRASPVVQNAYGLWSSRTADAEQKIAKFRNDWGIDPRTGVHGITACGTKAGIQQSALLIQADWDRAWLTQRSAALPDRRATAYGPYEMITWTQDKGQKSERPAAAVLYRPDGLALAERIEDLQAVLAVIDGRGPSVAEAHSALAALWPVGTAALVRAAGLGDGDLGATWRLLRPCDMLDAVAGEFNNTTFLQGRLTTRTAEAARQLKALADGLLVFVQLQAAGDAELTGILQQVHLTQGPQQVNLEFRIPSAAVGTLLAKGAKIAEQRAHSHSPTPTGP